MHLLGMHRNVGAQKGRLKLCISIEVGAGGVRERKRARDKRETERPHPVRQSHNTPGTQSRKVRVKLRISFSVCIPKRPAPRGTQRGKAAMPVKGTIGQPKAPVILGAHTLFEKCLFAVGAAGQTYKQRNQFVYLGRTIRRADGKIGLDIKNRISRAWMGLLPPA